MLHLQLFTDGSVNTKLKVGYGAYLAVSGPNASIELLKDTVKVKRFEQTSSTKLELQTLLSIFSSTESELPSEDEPNSESPTPFSMSHWQCAIRRFASGLNCASKGVTTGASIPLS